MADLSKGLNVVLGGAQDQAHANLLSARDLNPDEAARAAALAKRWDVGVDTAKAQEPVLARATRVQQDQEVLAGAPRTAGFLANPAHAAVAHDQVADMAGTEAWVRKLKAAGVGVVPQDQGPPPTFGSYGRALGVGFTNRLGLAGEGFIQSIADAEIAATSLFGYRVPGAELQGAASRERAGALNLGITRAMPAFKTKLAGSVFGGVDSTLSALPALAATIGTKNPAVGLSMMGGQTGFGAYSKYRERGGTAAEAAAGGGLEGTIEAATELLPMGFLVNRFGKTGMKAFVAGLLGREMAGEQLATFTQDAVDTAIANPDKTWGEFWKERPQAAVDTAVAVAVQGALLGGAHAGVKRLAERDAAAQQAKPQIDTFNELVKATNALPLRERSPEAFHALVSELTPGIDVHVNAQVLDTYLQSLDPEEADALVESLGIGDQLNAATRETDVVIPAAEYLSKLAPTDAHAFLQKDIKLGPAALSINEAEEHKTEREQLLQEAAAKALGNTDTTNADAAERVRQDFYDKAVAAGVPEAQAQANAALQAAYFTQRAERNPTFVDAWDAYEKTGLDIQAGGAQPGGSVFNLFKQAAPTLIPAVKHNGKVYQGTAGRDHFSVKGLPGGIMARVFADANNFGFVNHKGQFMTRERAAQYALDNDLVDPRYRKYLEEGGRFIAEWTSEGKAPAHFTEEDAALLRELGIAAPTFEQSVDLRNKTETLAKFGLDPAKKHNTRDVAQALEARQRKRFGRIARTDRSPAARDKIAKWMADEVNFELQLPGSSGAGWYSTKFQAALDIFAEQFPELATDQGARDTLTALIAITSDGQKVLPNFRQAVDLYTNFRETGKFTTDRGHMRQDSVDTNVAKIQVLYDTYGPQGMRDMLMQEATITELKRKAKALGVEFSTKYQASVKMPYAAVIFGPKLGAFYANLMGAEGYLTMDRWWSRTFNRYRGDLLDVPNETGLARVRELVAKNLDVTPDSLSHEQLLAEVKRHRDTYAARNFKGGSEIERASNTLYKAAFENLNDQPFSATDRTFMIEAVQAARKRLAKQGVDISVADVQAVLWYYEKRLYGDLGARQSGDVSYEETARRVVGERAGPSGPTAPADGLLDLGADTEAAAPSSGEKPYYDPARDAPAGTFQQSVEPDAQGMVTLSHFSSKGRIKQLDPEMHGENWEVLSDVEKSNHGEVPGRVYWGVGTGQQGEYQPELGIGNHRYETKVPLDQLYDDAADPQGFYKAAKAEVKAGLDKGEKLSDYNAEVIAAYENKVHDAGYLGYISQGGDTHTGPVVALFKPVKHTYKGKYVEPQAFAQAETATIDDFAPENLGSLLEKGDWAIMTAENPAARTDVAPEDNARLNAELAKALTEAGKTFYPVEGHYGQRENSFIITGITEQEAMALGQRFGQESVLTRRGLVYGDSTYQPAQGVTVHDQPPEDFYTRVPETGGLFTVDIDFDQRLPLPAQAKAQPLQQGPRGQVSFGDGTALIQLFKGRNASTLLHETSHVWLENLAKDAHDPAASQEVRDDFEIVKAWWRANASAGANPAAIDAFGTDTPPSADDIRPFHELFARAGERYFMEGKAPTPELRGAFAKFRNWLVAIYKDFTALKVPMTDEIRGVFDRLIAVPQALQDAAEEQELVALPLDKLTEMMSPAELGAYHNLIRIADEAGHDRLLGRVMADIRRQRTAAWKAEREALVEDLQAQVNDLPEMRALAMLESGEVRLARADVKALGFDEAQLYRRQRPYVFEEGLHPDVLAEQVGMSSGQALLQKLVELQDEHNALREDGDKRPVRRARAEELADAAMLAKHGDILNDGTIGDEAVAALNDIRRSEVLMAEVRALVRKAGAVTAVWTPQEMERWAKAQIAGRRLDGIRPHVYQAAEAKAGRDALKALVKDDFQGALDAKFRQLLNMHLYRAARDAREEIEKGKKLFDQIAKARNGTITKTRNMDMVGAARQIIAAYGFEAAANDADYMAKVKLYDPELWADLEVGVAAALAGAKPVDQLTMDEFQSLRDMVDQLWRMSRISRQMEVDFQALEVEDIATDLAAQLREPKLRTGPTHNATGQEIIGRAVSAWRAHLRRVESWVSYIDGGKKGPWRTYVWQHVREATDRYRLAKVDYMGRFVASLETIQATLKRGKIEAPELNHVFGAGNKGVGKSELLHAVLHTGNDSNKRKLLLGRGWATENADGTLNTAAWDSFIARMQREGVLTKEDYDWAQSTWDLLEEMKPAAQKAHRQVYGRYFEEVTANSFTTPYGTYKGGYVPALPDTFIVQDAALKAGQEAVTEGNTASMFPSPARGFTKSRVEYNKPLALDLGLLPQHIDKVLKFSHLAVPVRDVLRLLKEKGLSAKLEALDSTNVTDMLLPWLNRTARQVVEVPATTEAGRAIDKVLRAVRSRSGMGIMMFNLSNTVQQLVGWFPAALKVRKRFLTRALWTYARNPDLLAQSVAAASPFMATRTADQMSDIGAQLDDLLLDPTKYQQAADFAQRHAYVMQGKFQNLVDLVTWQGAFEQALTEGEDFQEAVRSADSAIRETQGSLSPEDVSAWETGSALKRLFTQFYSYFSAQGNLLGTELGNSKTLTRAGYVYVMGLMLPALVSEVIRRSFGPGWDDEDDDGYLDMFLDVFFGSQWRYATGVVPLAGALVNLALNGFNDKRYDDQLVATPVQSTLTQAAAAPHDLYRLAATGEGQKAAVRDTATLLTLVTGVPLFAAAGRPLGYLADINEGKVRPTGSGDFVRGLVTGTASNASKVN